MLLTAELVMQTEQLTVGLPTQREWATVCRFLRRRVWPQEDWLRRIWSKLKINLELAQNHVSLPQFVLELSRAVRPRRQWWRLGTYDWRVEPSDYEAWDELLTRWYLEFSGAAHQLRQLQTDYGVTVYFVEHPTQSWAGKLSISPLRLNALPALVQHLQRLLRRYPPSFIHRIELTGMVVGMEMSREQEDASRIGLGGVAASGDNLIYLSAPALEFSFDHEVCHQAMIKYDRDWAEWQKLRANQDLHYTYQEINTPVPGFARAYGKENLSEDQATIAEALWGDYRQLMARARCDEALAAKVALVKKA